MGICGACTWICTGDPPLEGGAAAGGGASAIAADCRLAPAMIRVYSLGSCCPAAAPSGVEGGVTTGGAPAGGVTADIGTGAENAPVAPPDGNPVPPERAPGSGSWPGLPNMRVNSPG